jgi:PAS domain S-box-containing protein
MIRDSLLEARREDLLETAELLVSEIVTNALVHAGTPIDVAVMLRDGGLRIEVTDGSPHVPSARAYGPSAGTGRGLMLLEEMVDEWGVVPDDPGKTVWFQIACRSADGDRPDAPADTPRAKPETVTVELQQVPLLLHEAWRQHAESLLREYLLSSLDLDSPVDPIALHAEASDALALLAENIPASGISEDPSEVLVAATEPLVTQELVELPVPVRSVPHFATLERTIVSALEMVESGDFLTPPTQPELQGLRAWLCDQVMSQSRGAQPSPWSPLHEPPPQYPHRLGWDAERVRLAEVGMVAVDDQDRIIAVSPRLLRLLGYDDPRELVGRRLVELIPPRFRQAHLAGFTMHFLTGRAPLIGRAVVVPALHRSGAEVEVELAIEKVHADDGHCVFVASLEPPPA